MEGAASPEKQGASAGKWKVRKMFLVFVSHEQFWLKLFSTKKFNQAKYGIVVPHIFLYEIQEM